MSSRCHLPLNYCQNRPVTSLKGAVLIQVRYGDVLISLLSQLQADSSTILTPAVWVQVMELPAMKGRNTRIVTCSATTGEGLLTAFDWLVADIRARVFLLQT